MSAAGYTPHASPVGADAVQGVEHLLALLSLMPAEEPPADLVARTLARCEQTPLGAADGMPSFRLPPGLSAIPNA